MARRAERMGMEAEVGEWTSFWNGKKEPVHDRASAERELEARWTHQLYREYDLVCYLHSVKMPKPLIRLADVLSTWGSWDPQVRAITISKRLIREHAWDVVI